MVTYLEPKKNFARMVLTKRELGTVEWAWFNKLKVRLKELTSQSQDLLSVVLPT